jgi:Carboxypeptidase regulatory-like domain
MKTKTLFTAFFIGFSSLLFGQSQSVLRGVVTDKTGETIIGGNITVYKDKIKKLSAVTDVDGKYSLNIDAGTYDVEFSYSEMKLSVMRKKLRANGKMVRLDVTMEEDFTSERAYHHSVCVRLINIDTNYKKFPLDKTSSGFKLKAEEIKHLPTRGIGTMINMKQNIIWGN